MERKESQSPSSFGHNSSKKSQHNPYKKWFLPRAHHDAWRVFESHYAVKSEGEREMVEDEWNELRQKEGENIMSLYGRAKAIMMKLESYGDKRPDASCLLYTSPSPRD